MQIPKDSTDITTYFVLRDSTTHAPKTDVTVTDIDLYYVSHKTAISSKADATALDAANSAHADNKAFNVGQGIYRIDWPDVWTGAVGTTVNLAVVCSGVDTEFLECEIVGVGQTGDVYAKLPTNFEDMAITNTTGLVDINDKTGFSLSNAGVDAIADEPYDNDGADISLRDAIRIFLSVLCGLSTGGGTNTISFRDLLNTKNRVSMTVDVNGNRTVTITRDGT